MHDHLFYVTTEVNGNYLAHDMAFSFPRLFLANGVTTIRTAGSYEPLRIWKSSVQLITER